MRAIIASRVHPPQQRWGYLNDPATRTIVPDPERFPLVRQMFDLMLTGSYSPQRICEIARSEWGFRTPKRKRMGGKPIALCSLYRMLNSPFYAGLFEWGGRTYKGAHTPMISIEEFDRIQTLLGRREKPRAHHRRFAFTGLIRCGECGLLVTAEEKTNHYGSHYTYYHCTRRRQDHLCRQPSITAQDMEWQIERFLGSVSVSEKITNWAHKRLREEDGDRQSVLASREQSVQKTLEDTKHELTNLISLRVRDLISDAEFVTERRKLEQARLRLSQQLEHHGRIDLTFEPADALISFSKRALDWFKAGDWEAKRLIFDSVGSNFTLKDKILSVQAKNPFHLIAACDTFPLLCGFREDIRTLYATRDPELLHVLDNIRKLEIKFGIRSADGRLRRAA